MGTSYDYDLVITTSDLAVSEYDALFEVLTSPVNSHTVQMPYGMSSITFEAMIQSGDDELIPMDDGTWWGNLSVSIRAKTQRLAE